MESNIRKLRIEKNNVTQVQLGDAIGVSQQIISRMEKDRNKIQVKSLIAMADYFGVSTDEVLGYQSNKETDKKTTNEAMDRVQSSMYELMVSMKRYLGESGI